MRKNIFFLLIILSNYCFSQCFTKAISEGNRSIDNFSGMSNDKYGNIYIVGKIGYTTVLGQGPYQQTLENGGNFIAKYDNDLNLTWLKKMPYRISAIATDSIGNSYLTGNYCNTAWPYDSNPYLTCMDIFIIKIDSAGNQLWFRSDGGPHSEYVNGIAIDKLGNCYITGNFLWKTYFGNDTVTVSPMVDDNYFSFVAAYDKDGNYKWIREKGLDYFDEGKAITVNSNGEIIVASNFSVNYTGKQLNISKYLPDGTEVWEINEKGDTYGYFQGNLIADNENNIYLSGGFGKCEFGKQVFTSNEGDAYIVKYSNSGIFEKIMIINGEGSQRGGSIVFDESQNIYLTTFYNKDLFYTNEEIILTSTNEHKNKWAIIKFNKNLKFSGETPVSVDCEHSGGPMNLIFNKNKKFYMGGIFNFSMTLPSIYDNLILNAVEHDHGNFISKWEDLFLAILDPECETTVGMEGSKTSIGLNIYPNPTRSSFTIHYQSEQAGQLNIKIRTLTGAVAYEATEQHFSGTFQKVIDIGNNAPGVYFVELLTGKEKLVKKVVVNR